MEDSSIRSHLAKLPHLPGVYLMQDELGKVIYIGAATNLKRRVSSYFRGDSSDRKTRQLVNNIHSFDYEIHESKEAAFIRERDLIRIYHPRYNLEWKDDKDYPLLQVTVPSETEKFTRLFIVRNPLNSHDWFFGRKKDVGALRSSIRVLRRLFPIANKTYCFRTKKPCLDYSIKRCSAPCVGKISLDDYQQIVDEFILFLQGNKKDLIDNLYESMALQSEAMNYEAAAKIRDRIKQIERTISSQKSVSTPREKDKLILLSNENHYLLLNIWVENESIVNFEEKIWGPIESLTKSEMIRSFLQTYYLDSDFIPPTIEISEQITEELETLEIWLSKRQGTTVQVIINTDIRNEKLVKPLVLRYELKLGEIVRKMHKREELQQGALKELMNKLQLKSLPSRIETYDISNLQGSNPVGSMVVFKDGLPRKSQYRKFKIKIQPPEPNDVAMMEEILTRRLKHTDNIFSSHLPDLIVIDGGKPQVNAINKIISSFNLAIPVIGLAKREEEVFLPKSKNPIDFASNSSGLRLLKQTRDEAHRFAIAFHKLRRRIEPKSDLENIPGIGKKRRKNLLEYFGSIDKIKKSSIDELCQVDGINRSLGEKIYLYFHSLPENK
ncbi:MAG: excinuclease ABC subunit UvrC [Candidatus Hodarchaeales archaeon]